MTLRRWLIGALSIGMALGGDWPGWRGPDAAGVSRDQRVPLRWSATENVRWKTAIPGVGHSSPIVWGKRIFLTTAVTADSSTETFKKGLYLGGNRSDPDAAVHRWVLLAVDLDTGKTIWQKTLSERRPISARHLKNSYASETPATDGKYVYAYFGAEGLYCLDYDGKQIWKRDLGPLKTRYDWGSASSPILYKDTIIISRDSEEGSFLIAIDKKTGEVRWKVPRDEPTSWSTPFLVELGGRTELVVSASNRVRSYEPATGKLYWECGGMSSIAVPTPVAGNGLLYVSSGYRSGPIYAIRPGAKGDFTLAEDQSANAYIAWSQKTAGPYIPSPLLLGDYLYVVMDRGFFGCYNAKTGERLYYERVETGAAFSASPVAAAGRIYAAGEDGDTYVFKAGPKYELLAKNTLDEVTMASPAIVDNSLILRTFKHLYRIAE